MNNKEIGRRITEARLDLDWTKKQLAEKIRVADSTIKRYEDGDIEKIKMPIIEAISNALNVNPLWVIGKSKDKKNSTNGCEHISNPDIMLIARAGTKMTPEQAEKLRKYAEFEFPEVFNGINNQKV